MNNQTNEPEEFKNTIDILHKHKQKEVPAYLQTRMNATINELFEKKQTKFAASTIFTMVVKMVAATFRLRFLSETLRRLKPAATNYTKPNIINHALFKWQFVLGVFLFGILIGSGLLLIPKKADKTTQPSQFIEIGKESKLSFIFDSQKDIENIVLNIVLPEGVTLASSPNQKTIKWEGALVKGKNVICLYVKAQKEGTWQVDAKLQTNRTILKQFKMPINIIEKRG